MMPARRAPSVCQAKRASSGPCCRSLGHTRNTQGLTPDRSGLDAEGEIIATGLGPAPYTRAAAIVGPDERCPTTATTVGSAYSRSAVRTAVSSLPESSTIRNSSGRPRIPCLALIWFTASCAARNMEAPRGWENRPASPIATGPAGREEHAASTAPKPTTSDVRTSLLPTRCGARLSPAGGKRNIPPRFPRGFPDRCGQVPFAAVARRDSLVQMEPSRALYRFAGALEPLLAAPDAAGFERSWDAAHLDRVAWEALALARRENSAALEPALHAVDRRLLAVLERCRSFLDPHLVTFRVPELERWQHAAAAALAGARWGVAGLRTVIADTAAPLGRRYFAFLALAERHPEGAWPLFERYLVTPGAHHAFVAAAVEAARFYAGHAEVLERLFQRIRGDQLLRRFLGPKILESLYVLGEERTLPLFEELLVTGHTDPDMDRCEVTRALVAVRRLTGRVGRSSKFADGDDPAVLRTLDDAARYFDEQRDRLVPVVVI